MQIVYFSRDLNVEDVASAFGRRKRTVHQLFSFQGVATSVNVKAMDHDFVEGESTTLASGAGRLVHAGYGAM